ncbi:MAG TPA: hypothetical protein VNI83_12995 [Vicinamibacterales bacterium]|nr:hypothetical protein [Vicinamibacterales bacterium]
MTPAFLGGAEGPSELRTPPFKSLLRRWWRVVEVGGRQPNLAALREKEGRLFGHAWLKDGGQAWASQSRVRIALDEWATGALSTWPDDPKVRHPEVGSGRDIGSHLYLGYGLLTFRQGRTILDQNVRTSALADGVACALTIRTSVDSWSELRLDSILSLWAWFGTIGSRARNGWGSLEVIEDDGLPIDLTSPEALRPFSRDFNACFDSDWPHALGRDEKGLLIWRTRSDFASWSEAMKVLAQTKIGFRTRESFSWMPSGASACGPRHVLAYPVTNHRVQVWERGGEDTFRLANQLLFKVLRIDQGSARRYVGLAVHLPHRLPEPMLEKLDSSSRNKVRGGERGVWQRIHRHLDEVMLRWT